MLPTAKPTMLGLMPYKQMANANSMAAKVIGLKSVDTFLISFLLKSNLPPRFSVGHSFHRCDRVSDSLVDQLPPLR